MSDTSEEVIETLCIDLLKLDVAYKFPTCEEAAHTLSALTAEREALRDAYAGAMADKRMWKRRAQAADAKPDEAAGLVSGLRALFRQHDTSAEAVERLTIALHSARQTHSSVRVDPKDLDVVLSAFSAKAERDGSMCKTCDGTGVVDKYSTWEGSCPDCKAAAERDALRDAYTGAMEDKRMWKRRAQAAEAKLKGSDR